MTRPRPRGVLIAAAVGALLVTLVAAALYAPIVAFLAGVAATTAGVVPFPALTVVGATALGAVVVLVLLVLAITRRRTPTAWVLAVCAVLVALALAVVPPVVVVTASAERASEVGPLIADLWSRWTG